MQKLIFYIFAWAALTVVFGSVMHLAKLESYSSADLVLALVILSIGLNWSGGHFGKDSKEKPTL